MTEQEEEQPSIFETTTDPELDKQILEVSRWTKMISVIGFGVGAFVVVMLFLFGKQMIQVLASTMPVQVEGLYGAIVLAFLIIFLVAAAVLYFLYKAATLLQAGVTQKNNTLIAEGFTHLNRFFIFMAIMTAISLFGNLSMLFS